MKKLLNFTAIILSFCLLVGSTVLAADTETNNSIESKKTALEEKGMDPVILDSFSEDEVNELYDTIFVYHNGEVNVSATQEVIVKNFPEKTENTTRGGIPESQLKLTLTKAPITSGSKVVQFVLIVDYYWNVTPGNLSNDLVAVNWDSSVFSFDDSAYFEVTNTVYNVSDGKTYPFNFQSTPKKATTGGLGFEAKLRSPDVSPKVTAHPSGNAFIYFVPRTTMRVGDNISTNFSVEYGHDSLGFGGLSFSIGYGGASVGISISGTGVDTLAKIITFKP